MMIDLMRFIAGILMILGSGFILLAAIGILRLPDLYMRMHAASKAGAMGAGLMLAAIAFVAFDSGVILRAIAGFVFLLLTTPVSAHLLARAAYGAGYMPHEMTKLNDMEDHNKK